MKKRLLALLTCALMLSAVPASANVDYSELDDMSLEELQALEEEVSSRISAMQSDAAASAGVIRLETDSGIVEYKGFLLNDQNFKLNSSDEDFTEALVILVDYTNKEDQSNQMQSDFWLTAYQNGAEMTTPASWSKTETLPPEIDNYFGTALKGGTITVGKAFIPADDSPVTILVRTNGGSERKEVTMELDFRNTPQGEVTTDTADTAAQDGAVEAGAQADTGTQASEEEIDAQLQGAWFYQGTENHLEFYNGVVTMFADGDVLSGSYVIKTAEQLIDASYNSSDGKTVTAHLPYTYENGTLTVFNNNNEALEKKEASGEAAAESGSELSAEALEAELSQQPVRVLNVEVIDGYDDRIQIGSSIGLLLPHVINESADDIKDISVTFAGWDNNNLPVVMQSTQYGIKAGYDQDVFFGGVNLVPGSKLNEDDADTFSLMPFDDTCTVYKAKAIVSEYTTFSGETWTNPLLDQWLSIYSGQKLTEPVIYTDQETIQKVQAALNEAGYECGTPDGVAGAKTYEALNRYQQDHGLPVGNDITDSLLVSLGIA